MKLKMATAVIVGLTFAGSLFATQAKADLLVEPFAGYEFGNIKQGNSSDGLSGANYGARLGYESLGFMIGGEYALGALRGSPSGGSNYNVSTTDVGIFAGYNFPVLLRVYGTYYPLSTATDDNIPGGDLNGTGYRVGIGFTPLPFITVAVEVVDRDYTKQGSSSLTHNVKTNSTLITVTLPFTL